MYELILKEKHECMFMKTFFYQDCVDRSRAEG